MRKYDVYFIVNLQAKNGYSLKTWEAIVREMDNEDVAYDAYFTEYSGHAIEIARTISEQSSGSKVLLVAVGGDGTLHEVVNGAMHHEHVTVANIPTGSGNDFSRGFYIPKKPLAALNLIIDAQHAEEISIDIGSATVDEQRYYFANNMGAGLDALITTLANQSKMKKILNRFSLGMFVYAYILIKQLFVYRTTSVELTIDGVKRQFSSVWFVTVSNQPFYGGGMKIAPKASPYDGEFDVTVVHRVSRLKILLLFIRVFWGGHTNLKGVECFSGRNINIVSEVPVPVHADGEYMGTTPLKIKVLSHVMTILRLKESIEMKNFNK